jgi:hypothetical protein
MKCARRVINDYDESGIACAIEILDASEKVSNPDGIVYEMKAKRVPVSRDDQRRYYSPLWTSWRDIHRI